MTSHRLHGIEGPRSGAPYAGVGHAFGAVTILNATATGIGCALAVHGGAQAGWSWTGDGLVVDGAPDDRLARAIQAQLGGDGARVHCTTTFGPARGLKSSSSAAAALLRAAHAARGQAIADRDLLTAAVAASRRAGVTLTGALDDQAAVALGGAHLTDNRRDLVVRALAAEAWAVAIWVPDASIPKGRVAGIDPSPILAEARAAQQLAESGRLPEAMTANGAAFTRLYQAAGLPVTGEPATVALAQGALGAGLSGTGPAVAALFERRVVLPAVAGGVWHWTEAVP